MKSYDELKAELSEDMRLGSGKDGTVFYSKGKIIKIYSEFGRAYSPITEYLQIILQSVGYPSEFVDLTIHTDGYSYVSSPFEKVSKTELPHFLSQYCALQSKLLKSGVGITDMGLGLDGLNFMKDCRGDFRWVDYGGIGFCFGPDHLNVIGPMLARILMKFSSLEKRAAANILCSELMALFFLRQLDQIYADVERVATVRSLWKAKLALPLAVEEYRVYKPKSEIATSLWEDFKYDDWTNSETWNQISVSFIR
jgi:hypothetical protein